MGILINTFNRTVQTLNSKKQAAIKKIKSAAANAIDEVKTKEKLHNEQKELNSNSLQYCSPDFEIIEKPLSPREFSFYSQNIKNADFNDIEQSIGEITKFKDRFGNSLFLKELGHERSYNTQALLAIKYNNPEHYKELLTLLQLSEQGKIKYIPRFIMPEGKLNPLVKKDMEAIINRKNYFEQFDKTANKFEILSKTQEGDAFSIGEQMYVRTQNNYDKIDMDKDTYKLLFPPIDRYAIAQGHSQNCGPLAVINNMIQIPTNRVKLYKLFEQKGNSIIVHSQGNIFNRSIFNLDELYKLSDGILSQTCYGIKMLEKHANKNNDIATYGLMKPQYGDQYFCKNLVAEKGTVFMDIRDVNLALMNHSKPDIDRLKAQIRTIGQTTTMICGGEGSYKYGTGKQHYISVFDCTDDIVKYSNPCGTAEYREISLENFILRIYNNVFYHKI